MTLRRAAMTYLAHRVVDFRDAVNDVVETDPDRECQEQVYAILGATRAECRRLERWMAEADD